MNLSPGDAPLTTAGHSALAELRILRSMLDPRQLDAARQAADKSPQYADLQFRCASLLYQRGELETANDYLDRALRSNDRFADALLLRGRIHADRGELLDAADAFQQVLRLRPKDIQSLYALAATQTRLGHFGSAREHLIRALKLDPDNVWAQIQLGKCCLCEGDYAAAVGPLRTAVAQRPEADLHYLLALLHLEQEQAEAAAEQLRLALAQDQQHLNAAIRLSILGVQAGDHLAARDRLADLVRRYPSYPDLQLSLAKVHQLLGDEAAAEQAIADAVAINPDYAEVHREKAYLAHDRDDTEQAVEGITSALRLDPEDEQAHVDLGFLYTKRGESERAVELLESAVGRFSDSWKIHQALGLLHLQQRALPRARARFQEALRIRPDLAGPQRRLRIALHDPSLLADEKKKLFARHPDGTDPARLHFGLGRLHLEYDDARKAAQLFKQALAATPPDSELAQRIRVHLATTLANLQQFDRAAEALDPERDMAGPAETLRRTLLGLFWANFGDHSQAMRYYQQVMVDHPLMFHSLGNLPVCFREPEELDDLLDDYQDYGRYHSESGPLLCRIAEVMAAKGMLVDAHDMLRQAALLDEIDPRITQSLGVLMMLRLEWDEAEKLFRQACEQGPEWSLPVLNLAMVQECLKRTDEEAVTLRRFVELEPAAVWREKAERHLAGLERCVGACDP